MQWPVPQYFDSTTAEKSPRPWLFALLAGAIVLIFAWHSLCFLCDDAYIAFRYVGNLHAGDGLVWNPAPFRPVEGYSCFLWVIVLWFTWAATGVEPPSSANWLALAFALATMWAIARALQRREEPLGSGYLVLALIGIATNVTFVTWASSGLETAMFGFFAVSWTLAAVTGRGLGWLQLYAALAALTRPDGGLLVLATIVIAGHAVIVRRAGVAVVARSSLVLLAPVLHVAWRLAYYGEWLPNTYYAKVVDAWPESGLRYLYCFVLEHGLVLWLPLAGGWLVLHGRRGAWRHLLGARFAALVSVSTWLAFVGYYTLVVGGDHFAWRPFAHLVPLLFAAAVVMISTLRWSRWVGVGSLILFAAVSNTFGWWYESALAGREKDGFVRASTAMPAWLGWTFSSWDRHRAWLRLHYVALPRGLHSATCKDLTDLLPLRRAGQVVGLAAGERAVYRTVAAGVVGWSLADVAIIDAVGLNDWVVARSSAPLPTVAIDPDQLGAAFVLFDADQSARLDAAEIGTLAAQLDLSNLTGVLVSREAWGDLLLALSDADGDGLDRAEFQTVVEELQNTRHMAHERTPPAGYIEALRPNVVLEGDKFVALPGVKSLTDSGVAEVERDYRARVSK